MSVRRLKKVTVAGMAHEKEQVLSDLQTLGCMHLIPLRDDSAGPGDDGPSTDAREALEFLVSCPNPYRQTTLAEAFDPAKVEARAIAVRDRLLDLQDRKDLLAEREDLLTPFGRFEFPDPSDLAGLRLWLYVVPDEEMAPIEASELAWTRVDRHNRENYLAVLSADRPAEIGVDPLDAGDQSLDDVRNELERVEMEMEDLRGERASLARWLTLYKGNLDRLEDRALLAHAESICHEAVSLFAVQGWVEAARVADLEALASRRGLALKLEDPGPEDVPPVSLHNPKSLSFGETLCAFYQLPGYRDWDPSAIVYLSFAVFFAMILADAAYGGLLGLLLLFLWKRMGRTPSGRSFRRMLGAIVGASIVFGVLVGSYFGASPAPASLPGRLKIMDINDFDSMMMLSIVIGAGHVILANVLTAWHRRGSMAAVAPLGWGAITFGALIAGLVSAPVGVIILVAGALAVLLFTGTRPVRGARDALIRLMSGLKGLAGISALFGDVLSYLRLFALGLASASLAVTFNGLASQVSNAGNRHGIALFGGLLILIVGHALNLTLGIVSGVVHGLRLNVIEFYKYSVFDEGSAFNAFRRKEKNTWKH